MDTGFLVSPHEEAAALIAGKPAIVKSIFNQLLPELRARAFTVAGVHAANVLQTIQDEVSALPRGQTWTESKKAITDALEPYLGDGAEKRAELVLRVNGFQAFSHSSWKLAQSDDGTTHLQYLHGDCKVPTPSHLALNGVVLPKTDPFWDTHTGPWGHLGCVCYFRTMSADQTLAEMKADQKRNPEDQLVITGPALRKLNEGTLIRGPRTYDVSPPSDPNAFQWHPDNLRIGLETLRHRYDAATWAVFEQFAKNTKIEDISIWDWLRGVPLRRNMSVLAPPEENPVAFKAASDARKWADSNMHPESLDLTQAERNALRENQKSSIEVNARLINGNVSGEVRDRIAAIDSAMAKAVTPKPLIVWRGGSSSRWHNAKIGAIIDQPAFLSTTLAETVTDFKSASWLKINVPKGAHCIYMDDLADNKALADEVEILLARGSKLLVKSVAIRAGIAYVECDLIV